MKRNALNSKKIDSNIHIRQTNQSYPLKQTVNQMNLMSIQFLQKKYQQQKAILKMQNIKLQQKLLRQLNFIEEKRFQYQKKQQRSKNQIQMLRIQNESLKNKIELSLQQQRDPQSFQYDQQQNQRQIGYLQMHKQLILKYQKLQAQYNELQQALILEDQQKQNIKQENQQMNQHIERLKIKILKDQEQFNKVKQLLKSYAKQKQQINFQYQQFTNKITDLNQNLKKQKNCSFQLQQELSKTKQKLQQQRKKKKQIEKHLIQLENKLTSYEKQQKKQYQEKIKSFKRQIQAQKEKYTQILTKLSFNQIAFQKKQIYIKQLQNTIRQFTDKKSQSDNKTVKNQKIINQLKEQIKKLNIIIESSKNQSENQKQQIKTKYENDVLELKKKTIEQIYPILKDKNQQRSKKNFESYLRNCKSSTNFQKIPLNIVQQYQNTNQEGSSSINPMARYKLQSQINEIQMQNINLKKQFQTLNGQFQRLKQLKINMDISIDSKDKQIQQYKLKIQKIQGVKNNELFQMRKELSSLKSKETQVLQLVKDRQDYQQAIHLKISFYDKKIKQLLQNIQRKDNIIEKYKIQKTQSQQKIKFYQEKLEKFIDEIESLKKTKNDLNRKDDLFKDYKFKYQKLKIQSDQLKESIEILKKQKQKIHNQLDSKEQYISSLKKKNTKNLQEIHKVNQEKLKNTETKITKNLKQNYQNKIKKLKKQSQFSTKSLEQIKETILNFFQAQINKKTKKQKLKNNNYEAAQLLGLNNMQIMEFINSDQAVDKYILQNLIELWENNQYQNFISQTINYIKRND